MTLKEFSEKLFSYLDKTERTTGLVLSIYKDVFVEEHEAINLQDYAVTEVLRSLENNQYVYIPEQSSKDYFTILDCSSMSVVYNDETVIVGSKYERGKIVNYTVKKIEH